MREAVMKVWAGGGLVANFVWEMLQMPIAVPLARIGPKVTFVHGRADRITPLKRVQALAATTGAQVLVTEDDHLSYSSRSAGRIIAALETP